MLPYAFSITFTALVWVAIVALNEKHGLLSCDRFPSAAAKDIAYVWLGVFMLVLAVLVTGSALTPPTVKQLASTPFYALFMLHAILLIFLIGWWALSGAPDLRT